MDARERCPLCGGPNECALQQGRSKCWCFFTPVAESALARLPEDELDKRCICPSCARGRPSPHGVDALIRELHRRG